MPTRVFTPVNQSTFDQLLSSYTPNTRFSDLLTANGYSTTIENISINGAAHAPVDFTDAPLDFSGCHFKHVKLSGNMLWHSRFYDGSFDHVTFDNVRGPLKFRDVTFTHCTVSNSDFSGIVFENVILKQNNFYNCDFTETIFAEALISESIFAKSKFDGTMGHQNTLMDNHLVFNQHYHGGYTFENTESHFIKPTVVIVDDAEWHSTPYNILEKYGAIPKTVNEYNAYINDSALEAEVINVINDIYEKGLSDNSIAEQVINSDQPNIKAIREHAHEAMKGADAVWIPGGPDLHTEFYNEENIHSYPSDSYYREILEFSLAQAAISMDKPILGICHGSQLMNVYLGGTLHQHVDTPHGYVNLNLHKHDGLLGSVISHNLIGPSYHHQAVKDVAEPLEVVASHNGVIKATQAKDGKKIMLCQFHPEYEADQSSKNILNQFVDLSSEKKIKSTVISLSDVLDSGSEIVGLDSIKSAEEVQRAPLPASCASNAYHYEQEHLPALVDTQVVM